jgi:hypothetical protein
MLSGECRIEAIPLSGEAVLLDGLRLRLDLRLRAVPKEGSESHLPVLSPRVQRAAALAGLSALIVALAIWSWGPAAPESVVPAAPTAAPALAPAASPPRIEPTSPVSVPAPNPAPAVAAVPTPASPPPAPSVRVSSEPTPPAQPAPAAKDGAPLPQATAQQSPPARARAPQAHEAAAAAAVPRPVADADLLYLFGDTK